MNHNALFFVYLPLLLVVLLIAGTHLRLFVYPEQQIPDKVDAVLVNSGGEGERLIKALELMDAGIAPLLILNTGQDEWVGQPAIMDICRRDDLGYRVECITAQQDNTAGEGIAFSALATEMQLEHVVLVTSTYHLFRARLLLQRYYAGDVSCVGAPGFATLRRYLHEWGGVLVAMLGYRYW